MMKKFLAAALTRLPRLAHFHRQFFWDIGVIPAAVLLIVAATLGWVTYDEYWQTQEAEYRLLEAHARNADVQVAEALTRVERLLKRIAVEAGRGQALAPALDRYKRDFPEIAALLVSDAKGRITAATQGAIIGRDLSREPCFASQADPAQAPKLCLSRPGRDLLGVTAVILALPVADARGQFLGIVGAGIDFRFFPQVLQAINPDDSASATVIFNAHGDLLLRRADPEKYFGFNIAKSSQVYREHLSAGKPVTRHVTPSAIDGKTRILVVREVGDSGLSLILSRQLDEVLVTWRRNVAIHVLIFAFATVLVVFLAVAAARSQRQVLAGKAFADQLIATANVMVVGLDAAGRVSIFNQTAERISGYGRDEILGRDWFELAVPPEACPRAREIFRSFQQGGNLPHTAEYPILTKTGAERIISWQNSVIPQPRAAISFGIDVTERRQMEAERERFVAMVSHEFRTPLATIDGAVQLLEMNAEGVDEASRKRYGKIQKAVDRLIALLDDYLLQEGLGRESLGLDLEPVSPLALLSDLQASSAALSADHHVVIDDAGLPDTVCCDANLMRFTLRGLADNGVKYTPPGSEIRLSCRPAREGGIEFLVRDNGPGIPEDDLPRLFDKFFRGRNAAQQSGTGLGLHLARSVAQSHGGALTARNLREGGAEFRLWLPNLGEALGDDL